MPSTRLHLRVLAALVSVVGENLLDLGPHAEHGAGQHVVRLPTQADLALLTQRRQLAVAAPEM